MEIGIIGLPQTGKKTLFNLLTGGTSADGQGMPHVVKKPNVGLSKVHDDRLHQLAAKYNPKAVTPALITYLLLPRLSKNSQENRETLKAISTVDAICHVVRAFDDETVFHAIYVGFRVVVVSDGDRAGTKPRRGHRSHRGNRSAARAARCGGDRH